MAESGFHPNIPVQSQPPKPGAAYLKAPAGVPKKEPVKPEKTEDAVDVYLHSVMHTAVMISPERVSWAGTKLQEFADKYKKYVGLSTSDNLMVALFARLQTAFYGGLLFTLGMKSPEIKILREEAIVDARKQNLSLANDNAYAKMLLSIVSGRSAKKMSAELKIAEQIGKQLMTQGRNLGIGDKYLPEEVLERELNAAREILDKFKHEAANLRYQLAYMGVE